MLPNPGFLSTSRSLSPSNSFPAVPHCSYLHGAGLVHSMSRSPRAVDYNQVTSSVPGVLVYSAVGMESGIHPQRSCGLAEDGLANLDSGKIQDGMLGLYFVFLSR
jgi:hypothetical protein